MTEKETYLRPPTGETTAAVPQPKTSISLPSLLAVRTSGNVILRSLTFRPVMLEVRSRTDCLVTPGRTVPEVRGGVTSSTSPVEADLSRMKMFMAPTSVISWSSPNTHNTC